VEKQTKYEHMNALGFHIPGAFDKVLDIEECALMPSLNNDIRNAIRDFAVREAIPFFDLRTQTGVLRNMMLRTSTTGEVMLLIQAKIEDDAQMIYKNFDAAAQMLKSNENGNIDGATNAAVKMFLKNIFTATVNIIHAYGLA
jgi:tRNA/tmRNA/rRNA uracil-C5-methylase (TrmA/RlmC/RlmD family)